MGTEEEIYMTIEEAEEIYMASQLGQEVDRSRIAHALILIAKQNQHENTTT